MLCLAALFGIGSSWRAASAVAQTAASHELSSRELHVWGRFGPGTWKQVRITTETLNERGEVTGITTTETKTTLVGANPRTVSLKIDVIVEVAGKRFGGQQQTVEHGYFGESPGEASEVQLLGNEALTIDGHEVPVSIRQVVATAGQQKQVTRLFLSDDVEPFILKRETTSQSADGLGVAGTHTTAEVIALERPYKVLTQNKSVAYERTIQKSPKGTSITLDVTCVEIPGGIVARTTKELDAQGRLVRRSSIELVAYHAEADAREPEFLTRRQAKRARRGR